jgi:hypothetical protein
MWRSVGAAHRAVDHAVGSGAPVGELPALVRRLQRAADEMDPLLAHDGRPEVLRPQVEHLLAAASDIRLAAVDACGEMSAPGAQALAADAEAEFRAMVTGLRRSRLAAPQR